MSSSMIFGAALLIGWTSAIPAQVVTPLAAEFKISLGEIRGAEQFDLGDDVDNVRVNDAVQQGLVGYADAALAILDAVSHSTIADVSLKAHTGKLPSCDKRPA